VISAKKRSTRLSQEADVGVKRRCTREVSGGLPFELLEEEKKLVVAVALIALADDLTGGHVELSTSS